MSRIGKKPISIPSGVEITIHKHHIEVQGPKGKLSWDYPPEVTVRQENGRMLLERLADARRYRALHGLSRALIANMVTGVSEGFVKTLDIVGIGYRAAVDGQKLVIQAGYSHPVSLDIPQYIQIDVERQVRIKVQGVDKQLVGQVAAKIRAVRPPDPYKGKGIKYTGEVIRRKAGKTGA